MKMYKKLMLLVGLAMLAILGITIVSFQAITAGFSDTLEEMRQLSVESEQIRILERKIDEMSHSVQSFVMTGDDAYLRAYEQARGDVNRVLRNIASDRLGENERILIATLASDLDGIKKKAEEIFALASPPARQKQMAENLLQELNRFHFWIGRDVAKYQNATNAEMTRILGQLGRNKVTGDLTVLFVLLASLGVLFGFVVYMHRTLSVPLNKLWEGTEEISKGNLDYRLEAHGSSDIALLSRRFNEMAQKLRSSYAELEEKLYDRTHELASLDAVALTLSQAGGLRDMLDKSLMKVLESLSSIEPKGGIFLCDPDGETLRLTAHKGLSPGFVEREGTIRAGECLCGIVARTGDLLFTRHGCDDPRHTRAAGEGGHAHIIIPIKSRGIVLGVIFLYPQKDFELKPSDVQMLDAIGAQLGMAVENFRFYAEVKESSEKYWDLFENSNEILFTMDREARLTAVNKAAEIFSGYSKVELFGKKINDFLTPEGVKTARRLFAGGFRGRQWSDIEVVKRDGSRAVIEVTARELMSNQQPVGYQVSARDVTEQKRLREMLLQAERLGAIGQIVVAVRHEINNPLTTVIGNIELLMERYDGKDKELMGRLETILTNALRIAEIVKQLKGIKKDKVVEYLQGVKMTDLKQK